MELNIIKESLQNGLLSFPITDFDENLNFKADTFIQRLEWFLEHNVSSVFVAGGTGEFFSLDLNEYEQIVKLSVDTVKERKPVIAGAGKSIKEATEQIRIAKEAGINAILLFPPYLTECPMEGIFDYAKAIIDSTDLPIIYYNRGNGVLNAEYLNKLAELCPNLIGLKDGTGNMQDLNSIIKTIGNRLCYIGGVPTAEIIAEAYLAIGVNTYSSAAFNFVPELANDFYTSLRNGNRERVSKITQEFFIPFVNIRARKSGYAVSLIKAGAQIIGKSAGNVRPPLSMPSQADEEDLKQLIEKVQKDTE